MEITSGFELTTAITNIIIFIVSIICFIKVKNGPLWKFFFLCLIIVSFLGTLVHGYVLNDMIYIILWTVMAIFFTFTINTLLCIFMRLKFLHVFMLSLILSILLGIQILLGINFILTFTIYVLMIMIICTFYILKRKNKSMYLIGFLIQLIGGIFMLSKVHIGVLNHNGIYHIFMAITLVFLYLGYKKDY